MEENNSFDWFAVKSQASDKSFADIYSLGVDPSNTTLESKDFYKKSNKIQQMPEFRTADGKFDANKFDTYYNDAVKSFNEYKKADFDLGNVTLDLWEDDSVARYLKAPIRKNPVKVSLTSKEPFTNLKQAQGSFYGISEINKWTSPTKTLSEVAQGQKVLDGATGKELDYKPEDTGLFNLYGFFSEPLVMAQYDSDIKDENGKVIHKKGEMKFDENGLPRFETLAGRDIAGKQILSRMDTLTKEGSFSNKFDFMDSDGFDKSLTGLIVKSAVELAPFVIGGPVSNLYKAYYIASGLIDGTSELAKSIDGIMNGAEAKNGSLYKFANTLQGYVGQQRGGMSEYGRSKPFGLESLASMAVDSVYQLMGQRAIAQWPSTIKQYQMAKQLGLAPKGLLSAEGTAGIFSAEAYLAKYGDDWVKAAQAMSGNVKTLEKYAKYSGYLSTAYMAATSAVGISQASEAAGLDAKDKGWLYLGYMGALVPLFRSNVGNWVEKGLEVDHLARGINKATKDYASKYLPQLMKEVGNTIEDQTLKGRGLQSLAAGKRMGEHIYRLFKDMDIDTISTAALAEATEEVTEQMLQQSLQGVYNGLAAAGMKSTQEDAAFDLNPGSMAQDLLASAVGGAVGGAIFKSLDKQNTPIFNSNNIMEYVTQGYGGKVIERINKLKQDGQLGSTTLSVTPLTENGAKVDGTWLPVNDESPISQNDFIADKMIKAVKVIENLRKGFGINNPEVTAEEKNQFFNTIVDTRTDTDLRDQIHDTSKQIYTLAQEIQSIEDLGEESEEGMLLKKAELKILKTKLEYLQGDDSTDEYFRQGLFNIRGDINKNFGVKNRQTFTEELIGKKRNYRKLNSEDKKVVDDAFEAYKLDDSVLGIKSDLYKARLEWTRFNTNMEKKGFKQLESFKQSMLDLGKFAQSGRIQYLPDGASTALDEKVRKAENEKNAVASVPYHQLLRGYLSKLEAVEYIPDFMYDQIEKDLTTLASRGAQVFLSQFAPSLEDFKSSVQKGLQEIESSMSDPYIKDFLVKAFGGDKFEQFTNSVEFKDLVNNKGASSDYSLLRALKVVAENDKPDNKILEYRAVKSAIDDLSEETIQDILVNINDDADNSVSDYLKSNGFVEFVEQLENQGLSVLDLMYDFETYGSTIIKNFIKYKLLSDKNGVEIPTADMITYLTTPGLNNLILDLILEGKYDDGTNSLEAGTIRVQDTTQLDESVNLANEFNKTRVKSPLRDILRGAYEFKDSEMSNLEMVGNTNYLNSSEEFEASIDGHLNAVARVESLIDASATMNPLINDFRKNNRAILPEELKSNPNGIELTELGPEEKSVLLSETNKLREELQYLKDVNEYNKNNILQKLLREDGLILAASVKTLKKISEDADVLKLLPTLSTLYGTSSIIDYATSPKLASADLKKQAIYDMSNFEHSLYEDFNKLSKEDQLKVINATFKPVEKDETSFYDNITGEHPLNDSMQTLYLAKIFGTSTLGFYNRYAGKFEEGGFEHIKNSDFIPFASQEGAVRLADLLINGNSDVVRYLFNAYAHAEADIETGRDYSTRPKPSLPNFNSMTVWGDPGTGKTTAVLTNIISLLTEGSKDVALLAPEKRQLDGLKGSILKSEHAERVSEDHSSIVKEFIEKLGLKDRSGKAFDLEAAKQANIEKLDQANDSADIKAKFNEIIKNTIFGSLNLYKAKSDVSWTLNDNIVAFLAQFKLIAIDEYTHINPIELGVLSELISVYNSSTTVQNDPTKKITIINLGDVNQMGYISNGLRRDFTTVTDSIVSQPLTTTLRSGWDLINNSLVDIRRRAVNYRNMNGEDLVKSEVISEATNNPIKINYSLSKDGNIGFQHVQKTGETSVGDLKFITDNKHLFPNENGKKSVVYIINSESELGKAESLMNAAIGSEWRNFVDIYTPKQVQGGEYKYAIIDSRPELNGNNFDMKRVYEFLNTMFSRATEATLFLNDGTVDPFAKFENDKKDKAIKQIKINDEIRDEVKKNKQEMLESILKDFVPKGIETDVKGAPINVEENVPVLPTVSIDKIMPLFETPPADVAPSTAKSGDVISYNTFSTRGDYDAIFKLLHPEANPRLADQYNDEVGKVIASYKYYLLHKEEIGDNRISQRENFQYLFEDKYEYDNPVFYIEASKRGEDGITMGRTEIVKPSKQTPDDVILSLKVKLAPIEGTQPLILTMGMLNSIDSIISKHNQLAGKDNNSAKIAGIFHSVNAFLKTGATEPKAGKVVDGVWRSEEFDEDQLKSMSEIFRSRILLGGKDAISVKTFKENYPDFAITEPQVVVASLVGDANEDVLNKNNSNPRYKEIWNDLKGKSVMFVSEIYEMQSLPPHRMLEIYMKQLELFNNSTFKALDKEGKENYIQNKMNEEVIKIGDGPNAIEIAYKPNLVKMVKLDNPKSSFLEFRERFLAGLGLNENPSPEAIAEAFRQFDMPIYVKDRLVKSLITLRQMLDITEHRKWFEANVLPKHMKNVENRVEGVKQALVDEWGEEFKPIGVDDLSLTKNSWIKAKTELSTDDFIAKLDSLLFDKESKLISGLYDTGDSNRTKGVELRLKEDITDKDLRLKLTDNKQKDFSGSILQVNSFQLLFKTKNLNFAELIDLSLTALSNLKPEDNMSKYDLSEVFKDGKIESVVVANKKSPTSNTDYTSNVLAQARQYGNGFTFGFEGLQLSSYNINFDKLLKYIDPATTVQPAPAPVATPTPVTPIVTPTVVNKPAPVVTPTPTPAPESVRPVDSVPTLDPHVEALNEMRNRFAGLQSTEFQNQLKGNFETVWQFVEALSKHDLIMRDKQASPIVENTVIGYRATKDGYTPVTLEDRIAEWAQDPFSGDETPYTIKRVSSTNERYEAEVETNGQYYNIVFEAGKQEFKQTMLPSAAVIENPMDKIREIEKQELDKFNDLVDKSFGDIAKDPVVKDLIEMNRQLYRHTVASVNLIAVGGTLAEYDAELANINIDSLSQAMSEHFRINRPALRALRQQLEELTVFMKQYKTNIC